MKNARVRTALPTYVEWLGVTKGDGSITHSEIGGELIWEIGDVESGVGIDRPAKEIAFQLALKPSVSQARKIPDITGEIILTGEDQYTGTFLQREYGSLTTKLSTDPSASMGGGVVQPPR